MSPKYRNFVVKLCAHDGNAFAVVGRCRKASRLARRRDRYLYGRGHGGRL